jgi:protein-S-isoprenylcysteine O-methyltransferase Ste14
VKPVDAEWVQEVSKEVLDTSELGSRGEIWFAGQVILALAVLFPPGFLRPLLEGAGWLGVAAGLGLMVAGQQALGANLTPFPKPRESGTLSKEGVLQYVRHPMYGGLLLAAVGFAAATGDELRMLLALAFFLVLDTKASVEEAYLTEKFGEEYERVMKSTKKFIPGIY